MDELQGKRVYIVEDNAANLAVFAVTLQLSGASVIQDFWNTGTGSELMQNLPVDVILLDLMLRNRISGYDIFDELRAIPELAAIPIVAVSAADPGIEIPKTKARGFAGFIGKPIKPYLFPRQIAAIINGEQVWYAQDGKLEDL